MRDTISGNAGFLMTGAVATSGLQLQSRFASGELPDLSGATRGSPWSLLGGSSQFIFIHIFDTHRARVEVSAVALPTSRSLPTEATVFSSIESDYLPTIDAHLVWLRDRGGGSTKSGTPPPPRPGGGNMKWGRIWNTNTFACL